MNSKPSALRLLTTPPVVLVEQLADDQDGVVSRRQAYALGLTRGEARAHIRARRWKRVGRQTLCMHRGPLSGAARFWAAVFEAGPRACLDGASALVHAGLEGFTVEAIRVSVPRGTKIYRAPGLNIRQTRRWSRDDFVSAGVPRTRPPVAAVRAALWAKSDKQAALVMSMVVQQGLTTAEAIALEMLRVRRDKRRAFVHAVLLDLLGGARSLGEIDVARECRRRGLPEPSRQVVRRGRNGKYYLDVYWDEFKLVVEVDGIQHSWAANVVGDALRQNDLVLGDLAVLRLPLLALRVAQDEFFDQIERALVARGCPIGANVIG